MKKTQDFGLLAMIILIYTTVCMETDIYVPAFPDMRSFFGVNEDQIQQVLSWNFMGICLGSFIFAPLSDSFGRKVTLQAGLILFLITSWGCVLFQDFDIFLINRFFQGVGAAAPMAISFALLLDKFDPQRSAQLCGVLNTFITAAMAGAPILGSVLNINFGWQANFLVIALLATVSFMGSFYGIPETLAPKDRQPFSVKGILKDYGTVATRFPYMAGTFICYLLFGGLVVFIANLSLIFIEYLGVPKTSYGFYQASITISFALASCISVKIIGRYGMDATKKLGLVTANMGAALLLFIAYVYPDPMLICGAMIIFTIGATFACPIYGIEAMNAVPNMRGIAAGMSNALRHIIIAGIVAMSSLTFDGTVRPVALIIVLSTGVVFALARGLEKRKLLVESAG